jgi:hypothetical protein
MAMKNLGLTGWTSIAEIVGTMAVLISLVMVVISVRENTAVIQSGNEDFFRDLNDRFWSDRINNPEVYENWELLLAGEPLSVSAKGQISDFVYRAINGWESVYVKFRGGQISQDQFDNWHEANSAWLRRRVPKSMWDQMSGPHWRLDFEDQIEKIYAEE